MTIADLIRDAVANTPPDDLIATIAEAERALHEISPFASQPVSLVRWVPIEQVTPNDYNPNSVARIEMGLLATSIRHDGYTQPIVTIYDPDHDRYVIVDGFHRYYSMLVNPDIRDLTGGYLPVVVIDKSVEDRMASTVRHNRARGKHSIQGMSNLVFQMLERGMEDADICRELGMQPEELVRLKHITGFSKLFQNASYRRAWMSERQVQIQNDYLSAHPEHAEDVLSTKF